MSAYKGWGLNVHLRKEKDITDGGGRFQRLVQGDAVFEPVAGVNVFCPPELRSAMAEHLERVAALAPWERPPVFAKLALENSP